MGVVRDNWRVALLVVLMAGSGFALFSPTVASGSGSGPVADTPTNLQYGLDLAGGTRIRAPLVGVTAEEVRIGSDDAAAVERRVAAEMETVDVTEVTVERRTNATGAVVVTSEVSTDSLATALDAGGYECGTVREGVTDEIREQTVRVLQSKINEAGLSGGTVQTITSSTGESFVLVEVPGESREDVIDLVESRGAVTVLAYHPVDGEDGRTYQNRTVLTREDFQSIGTAQPSQQGNPPRVPVAVREDVAERVQRDLTETGVASQGGSTCTYTSDPQGTPPCLLLVVDGQVVNAFGMDPSLARDMASGSWAQNPQFVLTTTNVSEARDVAINLRAGALPARLDIDAGTTAFISPGQGADFRGNSAITGLIAVLAVSGAVFVRYRRPIVALPMIVTALSEVIALLGFAAAIGFPLDLSVIAGFVAVIGTGVDDLIIIADEVMTEGDVNSRRVFQSRFRKAFWVIGAAAGTTIIAMSPLAILSLGDLRGFAIFTILGVVVGVAVTRPAYGDILRTFTTDR